MKKLLKYITKEIVDHPDDIDVKETSDESGLIILTLSVNERDMGRIIGKEGKMINAIRNLVRVAARKKDKRIRVELNDSSQVSKKPDTTSETKLND